MAGEIALPAAAAHRAIDHMNDDHREQMIAMARVLAGLPWVTDVELVGTDVELVGIDARGIDLRATGDGRDETARLDFAAPLAGPGELRGAIVALARRAEAEAAG